MKQLLLDIRPDAPQVFSNFVPGANSALLAALERSILGDAHVYHWGDAASGRTHLLRAAVAASNAAGRPALCLAAAQVGAALPDDTAMLIAIDDVEQLSPQAQIALFNSFNRARQSNQTLLLSGPCPPRALALREDLRTRIGQCLVFEVRPLDDAARREILTSLAERRGLQLSDEVSAFILRHGRRDLPSLVAVIDALDRASLEHKRPVTLALLRTLTQAGLPL